MTNTHVNFVNTKFALYENHPDKNNIVWKFCNKNEYLKIEEIFTKNVLFFDPFLIDSFFDKDDFDELQGFLNKNKLTEIAYTKQMNKWEDAVYIPQKFFDKAIEKTQDLLQTKDIELGYYLYAHHQINEDGRKPFLQVHLDWSPGSYMVDLHIGGNRDWGFVAHDKEFITNPNQAIVVQPEFDFHYRPPWNSDNKQEYYQALFFHLIRKDHWKNLFGQDYLNNNDFLNFQQQRLFMFQPLYVDYISSLKTLPPMVFGNDDNINENDKRIFGLDKNDK